MIPFCVAVYMLLLFLQYGTTAQMYAAKFSMHNLESLLSSKVKSLLPPETKNYYSAFDLHIEQQNVNGMSTSTVKQEYINIVIMKKKLD